MRKGPSLLLALAKAAWADCNTSLVPCLGKKAAWLQHSFQLSCVGVCFISARGYVLTIGQWHLRVALFAWKCQLEWVMSWQENRDVWLRRCWKDTDLLLGPWAIIKARGRETLKRFWPGQMKCRWKSRGPQGPGDFRPGLIRQGWKNWEYLTRREDDTDLLQISKLVTGQSNNDFIRKQLLTLLKMGQFRGTGSIPGQGRLTSHPLWPKEFFFNLIVKKWVPYQERG